MLSPTTLKISNHFIPLKSLGLSGNPNDFTSIKVRDILLYRNSGNSISYTKVDNISRSSLNKIVDDGGETILELLEEDKKTQNKKWLIFSGLQYLLKIQHTDVYKGLDCCFLFELLLGITDSYHDGGLVNRDKYKIFFIPDDYKNKIELDIGDTLLLASGGEFNPEKIISETLELTDRDFQYTDFHYAVYLGNGYYISKYGRAHKFCIGTLEDIQRDYKNFGMFILEARTETKSEYLKDGQRDIVWRNFNT